MPDTPIPDRSSLGPYGDEEPVRERADHSALLREMVEALEPFANAAAGVQAFDPDFPMEGAALRASFDWYDKIQSEPLKRHSVRRSDLENARAALRKAREVLS